MTQKLIIFLYLVGLNGIMFGQIDRTKAPEAQPNPAIKIEIPEVLTFANGLQVIMVENHKLPVVSFQLFVDYPTPIEGTKIGVSSIFGQMLESGTKSTPKDAFDEKIDYIGATFTPNSRGFSASSLKKHVPQLLTLLQQVLTEPAFTQEDFDRIISQNMSNLAALPSDASSISTNVTSAVNYGPNHPYGEIMTEETLENITLEDINAFYKKQFIPNHAYLVVVGDVSKDDVKDYVGDYFESWKKGADLPKTNYIVPKNKGNNVYFVDKPGAVQSVIRITHTLNLTPGHQDEIKLTVLNQILGGGSFSARLLSNLREDKAYTYGCYSSISSDPLVGSFAAGGSFRNEVTDSAIVQILSEIDRIIAEPVTDKELDLIKKSITGAFARSLEDPQTIARFALNTVRYNLPADYYSSYLMRLERITKEELQMVAAEYLAPKNLNIVVVGNQDIAEKLKVFDTDGKVDFRNYYGEEQEQLKAVEAGVTAQSVIDQYIMHVMMAQNQDELAAKMSSVQQIETISKAELKQGGMTVATLYAYNAQGAPNKTASLVYMKSPMGNQTVQKEWFDGTSGGTLTQGMPETSYEGEELENKKKANFPVGQMAYKNNSSIQLDLMGIVNEKDVEYYKIKVVEGEEMSFEFYAVKTGLLMKRETYQEDEKGEQTTILITYGNYQAEGGLLLAKNMNLNTQGQVLNFEVIKRTLLKKVKSKAFSGNFKAVEKEMTQL